MEDSPLVLAIPRRELFRLQGFTTGMDLRVLDSLAEETYFSAPDLLIDSMDAKEVRLALVVVTPSLVLVTEAGVLLHTTSIPPQVAQFGKGLLGLRTLAELAGATLLGLKKCRVELSGLLNDDTMPECRQFLTVAYVLQALEDTAAPAGMIWVSRGALRQLPLDPVSAMAVELAAPARSAGA